MSYQDLSPEERRRRVELGARIRQVVDAEVARGRLQKEVAEELGISTSQLRKLIAGTGGSPALETIIAIATLGKVSVEWLATGSGPGPTRLDGELLGRIMQVIARLHRDAGVVLSELELGRLAAEEHNAASAATPSEWPTVLRLLEARHRQRLAADTPAKRTRRGA